MEDPTKQEDVEIPCTRATMIHLSIFIAKKKKKRKRRRTNARVGMRNFFTNFFQEKYDQRAASHSEAVYEIRGNEWKLSTQSPQQSVIREGETRTNGEKSNSLSKNSAKEEPIPSGVESNEDRNTCYCFTLGDTFPINALTSRENDLLSIIIDF